MASSTSLTPLSEDDYAAIEAAVMETGRGRWFLAEFARRNRTADTDVLLAALSRLEKAVVGEQNSHAIDRIHVDLVEMSRMIAHLRLELAADNPAGGGLDRAAEALDHVLDATESATTSILGAAEQIQEMAWRLRENGADGPFCDRIDQRAADIYTACSFQDLTAQSTKKVVLTLRSLEARINGLIDAWGESGSTPVHAPAEEKPASFYDVSFAPVAHEIHRRHLYSPVPIATPNLSQDDIDVVIVEDELAEIDADSTVVEAPRPDILPEETLTLSDDLMLVEHPFPLPASTIERPENADDAETADPIESEAAQQPGWDEPEATLDDAMATPEADADRPEATPPDAPEPAGVPAADKGLAALDRLSTLDKLGMFA